MGQGGQGGHGEEMKGREGGKWFLWEVGMLVIDLMMPEVRMRNYDYEGVSVNWDNVLEKLRLWKIKASNKELIDLVHLFITFEYEN